MSSKLRLIRAVPGLLVTVIVRRITVRRAPAPGRRR
jgi:hypothetical protein